MEAIVATTVVSSASAMFTAAVTLVAALSLIPALGGKKLRLVAKDDAASVSEKRVSDAASGKIVLAFLHAMFLAMYYKGKNAVLSQQLELISFWSEVRNLRIIRKVNLILLENNKVLFPMSERMLELDSLVPEMLLKSTEFGVDPSLYLDESTDQDDVEQCTDGKDHADQRTKSFNFTQNEEPGKASDSLKIITDLNGEDWFVVIKRKFGPGRGNYALAGGFVDPEESFADAAIREDAEETDTNIEDRDDVVDFTITTQVLDVVKTNHWDPRGRFAKAGMENGCVVTHYTFFRRSVQ